VHNFIPQINMEWMNELYDQDKELTIKQYPMLIGEEEEEAKPDIGFSQFLNINSPPTYHLGSPTLLDSLNLEKAASYTGSWWSDSKGLSDLQQLENCSEKCTQKSLEASQQKSMSGKKTLELPELSLSLAPKQSKGTATQIGMMLERMQKKATSKTFQPTSMYDVTPISRKLPSNMQTQELLKEDAGFIVGKRELGSPIVRGMKRVLEPTQKVQQPNSGMDTGAKRMLLSTSSEDKLRFPMSYGGLTNGRSTSKSKGPGKLSLRKISGLRRICTRKIGIQTLMKIQKMPSLEDWKSQYLMDHVGTENNPIIIDCDPDIGGCDKCNEYFNPPIPKTCEEDINGDCICGTCGFQDPEPEDMSSDGLIGCGCDHLGRGKSKKWYYCICEDCLYCNK